MTPHDFFYFMFGIFAGICLMGMLVGLIIWTDKPKRKDKPKRNRDVGTPREQYDRFADYCAEHTTAMPVTDEYDICVNCPLKDADDCQASWMNLPYKEEQ